MKHLKNINLFCLCILMAASCSNEDAPGITTDPANDPDAVELGISAGVALTKSAINSGEQSGTGSDVMQSLAVYAAETTSSSPDSYGDGNNYAIYSQTGGSWENKGTDKIYLTNEEATIYAYHPAYTPAAGGIMQTTGTPLKLSSAPASSSSAINISVFEGNNTADADNKYPTDINNAETIWDGSNSTWKANDKKDKIVSAPGEVDYMWGVDNSTGSLAKASNGKKSGTPTENAHQVNLKMKHAMSMVSFRIYNDGSYKNTGKLTKIVLKNSNGTALSKGTTPTMNISTGVVTPNAASSATYSRHIENGYTLIKIGTTNADGGVADGDTQDNKKANAAKASTEFSILVLPHNGAKNTIEAVFTIDGADYSVPLAANANSVKWEQGKNNLYTAVLSGQGLAINTLTVEAWGSGNGGDLSVQ